MVGVRTLWSQMAGMAGMAEEIREQVLLLMAAAEAAAVQMAAVEVAEEVEQAHTNMVPGEMALEQVVMGLMVAIVLF